MKVDTEQLKSSIPVDQYYASYLGPPEKSNGNHKVYFCGFHADSNNPNLTVYDDGGYKCYACGESGDVISFHQRMTSLPFREAINDLASKYMTHIPAKSKPKTQKGKIVNEYDYLDEDEELVFQVVRYEPKDFRQRRPDGNGGWIWNLKGIDPILYRLPEVMAHKETMYICEGEKDVDLLWSNGLPATTCPQGAGKWKDSFNKYLNDRDVIVLPDNDDVGLEHGYKIANSLYGTAKSVKVVQLSGLGEKGDVSDYLQSHSIEDLQREVDGCEYFDPDNDVESCDSDKPLSILENIETWNEIRSLDIKVEWIVDRLIPRESIIVLFGKGGIGKTWLVMDIARCIGSGTDYLGYKTQQAPVVFVDFENPLAVLNTRTQRLGEAENVHFWRTGSDLKPPKLDSKEWGRYKELPKGAVLIFDTLRASQSKDENDSRAMAEVMNRLKELRDIGFTVILLHHTAKNSDKVSKGSTAIVDLADHILGLTKVRQKIDGGDTLVDDDSVDGFDVDAVYYFGNYEKTRFEPHNVHLKLNPDRGFELAPDPEEDTLNKMHQILQGSGSLPKTAFAKECTSLGFGQKKARKLVERGAGRFWKIDAGGLKNAQLVTAIKFGSLAPTRESEKLPNCQGNEFELEQLEAIVF